MAEIRTLNTDPVYSKAHPYPMALKEELNEQISQSLADDIIIPS